MSNVQGQTYKETPMSQCPKFPLDPPPQLWFSDPSPISPPGFPHGSNSFHVSRTCSGQRFPVSLVTPGVQSEWKIELCKVTSVCHILAGGIIHCRGQILCESLAYPTAIPWDNPSLSLLWKVGIIPFQPVKRAEWFLSLPTSLTENTGQKRWLTFQLIEPKAVSNKPIRTFN